MTIKTVPLYLFFGFKRSMSHYQRNSRAKSIFKGWFIIQPIHAKLLTVSNVGIYNLLSPPHLYILSRYIRRLLVAFAMQNTMIISKIVFTTHNEVLIKFQGDSDEKKDYCIKYTTTRIRVCGENRCSAWSRRYYVITGKLCGTHFVKLISLYQNNMAMLINN